MPRNQALHLARSLRGWSQTVLARHLETSTKNISRWERGETVPSPYYRERLCQLFGLDARSLGLLTSTEDDQPVSDDSNVAPTETLSDPATPPLLLNTEQFIGREPLLQDLLQRVQPGSTVMLCGLPGIGKTTLLQVLARHAQIQERFFDGVLWVGLGPTPDIPRHMLRLARLLNLPSSDLEQAYTEDDWSQQLRDALAGRHLLMILDDVWTVNSVLPFLIGGPFVAYAITTRLPKVAFDLTQKDPCMVSPLSMDESIHLLITLVAPLKQMDNALLRKVAHLTDGLPLAIMLIGRYLASHSYGGQMRRLEMALNQLADLEYRLNLSVTMPRVNYQHTQSNTTISSISAVISISDHQLPPTARVALRALSVMPTAPACFSEEAALAVSAADVEVLDLLVDMGLIEPAENHCYQIHRTIADYARHQQKDKAPQTRLVRYMWKVTLDHATNATIIEREYATLLAGLDMAMALQMHSEMVQGVLALVPFMRNHSFYAQADQYLRHALHAAIFQQDLLMCQKILRSLADFAQLRRDNTQAATYQRILQRLIDQPTDQNSIHILLQQIKMNVKEQVDTPRQYII